MESRYIYIYKEITFQAFLYSTVKVEAFTFKALPKTKTIQPGFIITNVVPGDYNYDGNLDVLLMGEESPDKNPKKEIKMQIYLGNGNDTFGTITIFIFINILKRLYM